MGSITEDLPAPLTTIPDELQLDSPEPLTSHGRFVVQQSAQYNPSEPQQSATLARVLTLISPTVDLDLDWQDQAVCAQTDPETFYPEKGCSPRDAQTVCRECPVRTQCLEYALAADERYGIWGAMTWTQRRAFDKTGLPASQADDYLLDPDNYLLDQSHSGARRAC